MGRIENYLLGMDCGTTNIKAVILGEDGKIAAEASRPNVFLSPGSGMHEQNADKWWGNAAEILSDITQAAGFDIVKRIRGISISSHTVSLLPLDASGRPLRSAITYQDERSAAELKEITDKVGLDRFIAIVAGQPSVAFLPNKILWYKKNEPELFAKTRYFLQASSYLNYKLTGVFTSDLDQASRTQCLDINTLKWSDEIGDAIGIKLADYLPEPRPVDDIIGFVTDSAAKETGLIPGIPVLCGCSDAMASMYATGMSHMGDAGESSGTTSLVFVSSSQQSAPDLPIVTKPCAISGMPWVFDAPIQTSGAALKWFIETFGKEEQLEADAKGENIFQYLNEKALLAKPGSGGLFFFPYLLGERAPLWNSYARGMFIGMAMDTSRADIVRSIFEGTSYALRHVVETIRESGGTAKTLRICGGGAKSKTWSMIKASMLKMPVYLLDETSGDVPVGDCLIAGTKVGVFPSLSDAVARTIRIKEIIQPVDEWVHIYDDLYPYYVKMYADLDKDLMDLRATMTDLRAK